MNERFSKTHQPCPCGDSSDAYSIRQNGSGKCFSCGKNFGRNKEEVNELDENVTYEYVSLRSIPRKALEFYGVQTKFVNEVEDSVAFPYGEEALKIRSLHEKKFQCVGNFKDAGMFGQDKFDPGSKDSITITEGEFDAVAAYDMLRGRSACVSVKSGAQSALADLRRNWAYINSFSRIYLCFDNDEPGRSAVRSLSGLFDFSKVYHVKFHKYKDANEYLQNGEVDEFEKTWQNAKRFAPDNIISSFKDVEKALEESSDDQIATYFLPGLQEKLYGLYAEEVICIKAPEGVGKTEFFRAQEYHTLKETTCPIGIIHLEENNATTIKALAGYELEVPATLPDCGLSREDILSGYRRAVRDDEGRVHIHASYDVEDEEAFLGNIRFLVSAAGCRLIFLDHITWLATGLADEDERKKLDRLSQKLKLLAKELRFCLVEISHVNDDGKTRGSRNISKAANTVISLSRDLLAGADCIYVMVEKARLGGRTGPAGCAYFDRTTGKLSGVMPEPVLQEED